MRHINLLFFFLLLPFGYFSQTQVSVNISGIRSTSGNIRLAFYYSSEDFKNEKPAFIKTVPKSQVNKGKMQTSFTLKPGTYGIAILDDENANHKMDYGMILPNEGFGFSDYYHSGMSMPSFEKFKFTLNDQPKSVQIKLRYM